MDQTEREKCAEHMVEAYSDMLIRIGYTWFGNPYDAQDICQTVLMKRMERTEGFATWEAEKAWLLRVAVNECKSLRRSAWFRRTVGLEDGALPAVELPERDESGVLELVRALPLYERSVIFLRYYEGYPVKEIAALLGRPPNLVSKRLARAKAKLKNQLGGEPGEE